MYRVSLSAQFCIFGAVFLIGIIAVSFCNAILGSLINDERTEILIVSVLQSVIAFCLPSVLVAYFSRNSILSTLSIDKNPGCKSLIGVILSFGIGFIFLNQIIYWNDNITLPESLKGMEHSFREMENAARNAASVILGDTSVWGLITSILVVGIITGISEELFFRAGLQRLLYGTLNPHIAIWLAAFIFSLMHFQFFGFIPRMLIGAFFGYLYYWTGSIWTAIFAHSLNNSLVVVTEWLISKNILHTNFDNIGISQEGFPILATISLVALGIFLYYHNIWFKPLEKKLNR